MFLASRFVIAVAAAAQPQHRERVEHSATAARRLVDTSLGTEESADDYDVGIDRAVERRTGRWRTRFLDPPAFGAVPHHP